MRFVAGPRQCGKTTLARAVLRRHDSERLLFNWDVPDVRRRYRADSLFYEAELHDIRTPWACFDEIHKHRQWKNVLKGIYDRDGERVRLLVTGSARLDAFRRAGDALAGRYFLFHLSPVALGELLGDDAPPTPPDDPASGSSSGYTDVAPRLEPHRAPRRRSIDYCVLGRSRNRC